MTKATIPELIHAMQTAPAFSDPPMRDKTALTYTPDFRFNKGAPEPDGITGFAAVQDQLGLKVEQSKAMVDMYPIDHVEKHSGN